MLSLPSAFCGKLTLITSDIRSTDYACNVGIPGERPSMYFKAIYPISTVTYRTKNGNEILASSLTTRLYRWLNSALIEGSSFIFAAWPSSDLPLLWRDSFSWWNASFHPTFFSYADLTTALSFRSDRLRRLSQVRKTFYHLLPTAGWTVEFKKNLSTPDCICSNALRDLTLTFFEHLCSFFILF